MKQQRRTITFKDYMLQGVFAFIPNKNVRNVLCAAAYTYQLVMVFRAVEIIHELVPASVLK